MSREAPSWGIEPVPERLRVLGGFDTTLLWVNLGVSLLVLVLPAYFDLSLGKALLATLVGGVIGNAILATAGMIGADGRVPTMVLQRAPLGHRGSYLATALNVAQCLGWAVFELIVIAKAASLLSDKFLGFQATWVWTVLFGVLATILALAGPISFVRRYIRKVAIWAVVASIAYLTWWILDGAGGHHVWSSKGHHGSFWAAVDIVIAVTVSWAPLVADYTRFSRSRRGAFWGVGIGYLLPTLLPVRVRLGARALAGGRSEPPGADPDRDRRRRARRRARPARPHRRRDRRSLRERVLDSRLRPERGDARAPAPADRGRRGGVDRRRARDRPAPVPALPLPARVVLRTPARGPARRLAARRRRLHDRPLLRRPRRPAGPDLRVARRVRSLPVAAAAGPVVVARPDPPQHPSGRLHRVGSELRSRVRPLGARRPPHPAPARCSGRDRRIPPWAAGRDGGSSSPEARCSFCSERSASPAGLTRRPAAGEPARSTATSCSSTCWSWRPRWQSSSGRSRSGCSSPDERSRRRRLRSSATG